MDQRTLEAVLADLPIPAIRYFKTLDSTNDETWRWMEDGAPDHAFVFADQQSAGRGRLNRQWITTAGTGLAFSLLLLSPPLAPSLLTRLSGLGALAACQAMHRQYSLFAQVKWPNDILLDQRKTGGVLVETRWSGQYLKAAVIGIGINVAPLGFNHTNQPVKGFAFPATCVEDALGHPVDRLQLLQAILQEFFALLPQLDAHDFIETWESYLAYLDCWVELSSGVELTATDQKAVAPQPTLGKVIGLTQDGALRLQTDAGRFISVPVGEIHLRPVDSPSPG